jgi:ribose-phosphate pyrophosphokinase
MEGLTLMHISVSENVPIVLFFGTANPQLARDISHALNAMGETHRIIIPSTDDKDDNNVLQRFPDGEVNLRLRDSVRGCDTYIIQPTCPPVNENLMELFIMLETFHRASASRITAITPYYGYARQDRKVKGREPITAKMVAKLLEATGISRVVSVDLHSPAIQGFFEVGMDHLTAMHVLASYLQQTTELSDAVVVSPDTGGVKRADAFARYLDLPLAILHKRRATANRVEMRAVIGDVRGKRPILIDDIISTGNTIRQAADALQNAGSLAEITVVATHPVLVGKAIDYLRQDNISRIVVTDSIQLSEYARQSLPKIEVVSIAPMLAEAIYRLHHNQSLTELFQTSWPV